MKTLTPLRQEYGDAVIFQQFKKEQFNALVSQFRLSQSNRKRNQLFWSESLVIQDDPQQIEYHLIAQESFQSQNLSQTNCSSYEQSCSGYSFQQQQQQIGLEIFKRSLSFDSLKEKSQQVELDKKNNILIRTNFLLEICCQQNLSYCQSNCSQKSSQNSNKIHILSRVVNQGEATRHLSGQGSQSLYSSQLSSFDRHPNSDFI